MILCVGGDVQFQKNCEGRCVMKRALFWSASILAVTWAASAAADPPNLKGAYGFTGSAACMSASPGTGFNPNFTPTDGTFGESFAVEGIRTFNGDGTGTVKGSSMGITFPALHPGAGSDDFQFSFTYTVNGDGSWTSSAVGGTLTGTVKTGPRTGQTFTISNFPGFSGLISRNGSTLTVATLDPTVETITYSNGDSFQRICHRSRVLIKLQDDGDDHGGR
jgi:hypothetical protein